MAQEQSAHPPRIPALDGVRGFAALLVITSHFFLAELYQNAWWWTVGHAGWIGVDLFFVLSGFLITGILHDRKGKPNYFREFYRRRILRIFPLYYAVVLWSMFAVLVIDKRPENLWNGYDSSVWFLTFLPNVAMALKGDWIWQTNWAGLSHLWSLAVEEQFYMIWPLVVWLLPRRTLAWVCVAMVGGAALLRIWTDQQFGQTWSMAAYVLPYCRMDGLAAGSLLALWWKSEKHTFPVWQRPILTDLTFGALLYVVYLLMESNSHWRVTFIDLAFFGVVYLALCPGSIVQRFFQLAFLRHLGLYSYALYIFHQMLRVPFEEWFQKPLLATNWPPFLIQTTYFILAFGTTYLMARISWKLIEEPFLKMK
jgi:peptidoglycan/LPS O-acetylase OafA/YrhL